MVSSVQRDKCANVLAWLAECSEAEYAKRDGDGDDIYNISRVGCFMSAEE